MLAPRSAMTTFINTWLNCTTLGSEGTDAAEPVALCSGLVPRPVRAQPMVARRYEFGREHRACRISGRVPADGAGRRRSPSSNAANVRRPLCAHALRDLAQRRNHPRVTVRAGARSYGPRTRRVNTVFSATPAMAGDDSWHRCIASSAPIRDSPCSQDRVAMIVGQLG